MAVVIKDEKTGTFMNPVFFSSIPDIVRQLTAFLRQSPDSLLAQFPQDYSVWHIADWDGQTGVMDMLFDKEWVMGITQLMPGKEEVKK